MSDLILASSSPRRQSLLKSAGISFTTRPAQVDESMLPGEAPTAYVRRIATTKAQVGAPGDVVIAADTVVELNGAVLGKPADAAEAAAFLGRLSGHCHRVYTCVVLRNNDSITTMIVSSLVQFRILSGTDIAAYVATGDPFDKAGAYGIQGAGMGLVQSVQGSYTNVIGLPLAETLALLQQAGIQTAAAQP
jgi:septum formation protein